MSRPVPPLYTTMTRSDLLAAGLSAEEIDRLEKLRGAYPYVEFLDSRQELQRLRFMKWMIRRDPSLLP